MQTADRPAAGASERGGGGGDAQAEYYLMVLAARWQELETEVLQTIRGAVSDTIGARLKKLGSMTPAQLTAETDEIYQFAFDLIALVDVPATALTEAQIENLAGYVRDLGGGLLMAGARQSFGMGGYAGTPLEEALPATFDLRRRRDRLSLSLVIAIDRSGSMSAPVDAQRTKIDLANEAAARSALLLSPLDRVAIAHIDTETHWTQPMTAVQKGTADFSIGAFLRRPKGLRFRTVATSTMSIIFNERDRVDPHNPLSAIGWRSETTRRSQGK